MCGIVGILDSGGEVACQHHFIEWCCDRMVRRGPDSGGAWTDNDRCMFGFRRLAIRDTHDRSNQPMVSPCGNFALVYNGEIYNVDAIKKKLGDQVKFATTSDTEALLHCLIEFGTEATLDLIDGIFAFAIYNLRDKVLHVARDRAGVKPLYIASNEKYFVFSSQYDHLVNHPAFSTGRWNGSALKNYFHLGYVPEGEGLIEQTMLVPHGHWVEVEASGKWELKRYFDFGLGEELRSNNFSMSGLGSAIDQSVKSQLVADVPVGTFLSGGVDSPLVNLFAVKHHDNIDAYTIQVDDKEMDESEQAKEYSTILRVKQHIRNVTPGDLASVLADNAEAYSEPFGDFSSIPCLALSEFIRTDKTVALSGDGGDELYWGYDRCQSAKRLMPWVYASKLKLGSKVIWERLTKKKQTVPLYLKRFTNVLDYYYRRIFVTGADYWSARIFPEIEEIKPYFYRTLKRTFNPTREDLAYRMQVVRKLEFDLHLQRILIKVDRASMFHSLEVRVPLLSNAMLELAQLAQYGQSVKSGIGKWPLKRILGDATQTNLPFEKKRGFNVPLRDWLRTTLRQQVESLADRIPTDALKHMDVSQLREMTDQHLSGTRDWTWSIWAMMSLAAWSESHLQQFKPVATVA